ncbi:uncharacterized protein SPPG_05594 [Spizellomyces punctatus DAOM BR117]|uniref:Phosphoglycerate mutase n=1 Tax=Spizellomyces punctatus (strain DAOM BR117) TaxID=645134 RepID=A0A0L0HE13_SPIPD|nr:uncharacterized protein SPPG_05594 [Spizellomyces punctatus DAOM BR117]KNC99347.1 hypothetical protein SPPG_05594 [Spizellomyces punctatus DAOM BR117]|eukprot:XP_016607387.1 hypothetical protein SPPG_05594 [Spizellomyces punctatus DAOM BR117]
MSTTVYLIRHGERIDHIDPSWSCTASQPYDPPLSPGGIRQACRTGSHLSTRLVTSPIRYIFSSPFKRCIETAEEILHALTSHANRECRISTVPYVPAPSSSFLSKQSPQSPAPRSLSAPIFNIDNRLSEWMSPSYFSHPPYVSAHSSPYAAPSYPESYTQMASRFTDAFNEIVDCAFGQMHDENGSIVIVTHGVGIKAILESICGHDVEHVGCASITKLSKTAYSGWKVGMVCDESHLGRNSWDRREGHVSGPSSQASRSTNVWRNDLTSTATSTSWGHGGFATRTLALLG